ncbi:MAG: hypothetical protein IPK53_09430 [bacterium]|nr:hypothetical protein [bacterium]
MTTQITQNIIVGDSAHHVFEQWAHVENFPHFMKGVQSVRQTGEHTWPNGSLKEKTARPFPSPPKPPAWNPISASPGTPPPGM